MRALLFLKNLCESCVCCESPSLFATPCAHKYLQTRDAMLRTILTLTTAITVTSLGGEWIVLSKSVLVLFLRCSQMCLICFSFFSRSSCPIT